MKRAGKALVFGDDTRSFLATVRALGRQGIEVHAAPFDFGAPALRSRYIARCHHLPYYLDGGGEWLDAMRRLLREEHYQLIIPCDERALLPLCLHREELSAMSALAIPGAKALDAFFDKVRTRALASELGVPVAGGRLLGEHEDAAGIIASLGLPIVLKQPMSYALPELYVRASTSIVHEAGALRAFLAARPDPAAPLLLEQLFEGAGVGVSVLSHEGEVLQAFEHHRAHELDGSSYYRKSMALDPDRLDAVRRLCAATSYTGVAMFEFKVKPDGRWILIEVNARPWGSLPLPVSLGVDFPYRLYQLLVHGQRSGHAAYPLEHYGRNLMLDFWQARVQAAALPAGARWAHWGRWLAGFHRVLLGREHQDACVLDDMAPGLKELHDLVGGRVAALRARLGQPVAAGSGLAARLASLEAASKAPIRILFVCQGNINRSSYAEHKARSLFGPRYEFSSAGMLPRNRRPSPAVAIAAAGQRGVDLAAHRSRHASAAILNDADLVIAFDQINLRALAARQGSAANAHLLGEAIGRGEIIDPEGHSEATFAKVYAEIDACLQALAAARQA